MFEIIETPIEVYDLLLGVDSEFAQGINLHVISIPKLYQAKKIKYVEVKSNGNFTARQVDDILAKMKRKWDIVRVSMLQREGNLLPGDIIAAIAVSAYNSQDAVYAIDFFHKEIGAIHVWRKFYFEDGSMKISSYLSA